MKLSKLPIILTIATIFMLLTVSLVNAQNPIGAAYQPVPFESNPTADTIQTSFVGSGRASAYDGDLNSAGNVYPAGTQTTGFWRFASFTAPASENEFPIGWLDIKIKYMFPTATTDDLYRFQYSLDGVTWLDLTADTGAKFDSAATSVAQVRSWAHLARPGGGSWTWADLPSLRVQVYWTRGGAAWDGSTRKMYISEIWASVYGETLPPSGTSISVQPPTVPAKTTLDYATDYFFVEITVREVTNFAGYQFILDFDPSVLQAVEAFSYYPMTDTAVFEMNNELGYVSIGMSIPTTDPLVSTGITGAQFVIARINFMIADSLTDPGVGVPQGTFSPLTLRPDPATKLVAVDSSLIPYTAHQGQYGQGAVPEFPLGMGLIILLAPLAPIAYLWRTRRKVIKK